MNANLLPVLLGFLRQALAWAGAYVVSHGIVDQSAWEGVAGAAMASLAFGWGIYTKTSTMDQAMSLLRTGFSAIGGVLVFRGWVSADIWQQVMIAAMALATAWGTARANGGLAGGLTGGTMHSFALPIVLVALLGLLGGCASTKATLDPAVTARVKAGAASAADRAQASLVAICNNYQIADLAFNLAVSTGYIPERYAMAEKQAVGLIERTCSAPPNDPVSSYKTALDAWTTIANTRAQFRSASKAAVVAAGVK